MVQIFAEHVRFFSEEFERDKPFKFCVINFYVKDMEFSYNYCFNRSTPEEEMDTNYFYFTKECGSNDLHPATFKQLVTDIVFLQSPSHPSPQFV